MNDEFNLVEPFYIDDGELSGFSNQYSFVLGFELGEIIRTVELGHSFERMFHSDNAERVKKLLERRGVNFTISHHDDWPILVVEP